MKKEHLNPEPDIRFMMKPRFQTIFFTAWFCLIVVLSVIPDNTPNILKINIYEFRLDYLKHFMVYLPLGFCILNMRKMRHFYIILLGLFVVSLPEAIQYFIPSRMFNPFDLLSNVVGLASGVCIYFFVNRKFNAFK